MSVRAPPWWATHLPLPFQEQWGGYKSKNYSRIYPGWVLSKASTGMLLDLPPSVNQPLQVPGDDVTGPPIRGELHDRSDRYAPPRGGRSHQTTDSGNQNREMSRPKTRLLILATQMR